MHKSRVIGLGTYFPFLRFLCVHVHTRTHRNTYSYTHAHTCTCISCIFHSKAFSLNVNCPHLQWSIPSLMPSPCMYLVSHSVQVSPCGLSLLGALSCVCPVLVLLWPRDKNPQRSPRRIISRSIFLTFSHVFLLLHLRSALPHLLPSLFPSLLLTEWDIKTEETSIYN